jgi:hypothetical protein
MYYLEYILNEKKREIEVKAKYAWVYSQFNRELQHKSRSLQWIKVRFTRKQMNACCNA